LDRIIAAANRLKMLKDEEIGSIPLKMTYFYLFSQHRLCKRAGLCDTIVRRLYAEEWDHLSDGARQRHRDKLKRQLIISRRWSIAVNRLSHGVILLAGKKLSTLM
jgi:hypothetical protein